MKRYKLLKDLPFAKAGTLFTRNTFKSKDGLSDYDYLETSMLLDGDQDETCFGLKRNYFINNFDEWFEEIKEPKKYYYILDIWGVYNEKYEVESLLKNRKEIGNYFKTEEEAEEYLAYLKAKAVLKEDTKGFKPDWTDEEQNKYSGCWKWLSTKLDYTWEKTYKSSTIYFKSEQDIKESFKKHPEEWKIYLTYEQ
nr:MAG TPA: hypothetical protein [Caudoviricetes sp.]